MTGRKRTFKCVNSTAIKLHLISVKIRVKRGEPFLHLLPLYSLWKSFFFPLLSSAIQLLLVMKLNYFGLNGA